MRADAIRRVVLALALLFLAASLLHAWRASAPLAGASEAGPVTGAALYARHCAGCHPRAALLETLRAKPLDESALSRFLSGHAGASVDENRSIGADLLLELSQGRSAPAPGER